MVHKYSQQVTIKQHLTRQTTTTTTPTQTTNTTLTHIPAGKMLMDIESKNDKYRLGAGIIFFNDYSSLMRCIESIKDGVDSIFCD